MKILKKKGIVVAVAMFCAVFVGALNSQTVGAASFVVSPMNNNVIINPGESYESSFRISNPNTNESDIKYEVKMEPFYEGNDGAVSLEEVGTSGQILDWTTLQSADTGILAPNEVTEIKYTINVPENAAGGGQYLAFTVEAKDDGASNGSDEGTNAALEQRAVIAYRVFVEVAGDVTRSGEVQDINVPGFMLGGNIFGSSTVKNTGNVHGKATYKLQVFPLFSNEEIYANEEDPTTTTILPDRTRYEETTWAQTPNVGIFNVVYTVEFEGEVAQVSKMVIICPIWLLFIVIFAIFALIFYFVAKAKARKKAAKKAEKTV